MSDNENYCSYCGERAVLIRTVGKGLRARKECLCNACIEKEENGNLKTNREVVDNI